MDISTVNKAIASICIEKEDFQKYRSVLDKQPGFYNKCEAFVAVFRGMELSRNLTAIAFKKLYFLGRQIGLTDETLQLLTRSLNGDPVNLASVSFLTSDFDTKTVGVKDVPKNLNKEDKSLLEFTPNQSIVKRRVLRAIIGIAAVAACFVWFLVFYEGKEQEEIVILPEAKAAPSREERLTEAIQKLNLTAELGTVEYTVSGIHSETDPHWISQVTGDIDWVKRAIAIEYQATVTAGIDMRNFSQDRNVSVSGSSVILYLPKAEITSINIKECKDHPYAGLLRSDYHVTEKHEIAVSAERALIERIGSGREQFPIKEDAEENARRFFEMLMHELGFESVKIVFR